jgi:hypothetical protein
LLEKAAPAGHWEAELGRPFWWVRAILFAAVAGLTLGVIGFLDGDLLICIFDWTAMVVGGAAIAALAGPPLVRFGRRWGLNAPLAIALTVVLTAVPISGFAAGVGRLAWPKAAGLLTVSDWYLKTLFVEALIVGLWALTESLLRASRSPARARAIPALAGARLEPERPARPKEAFCLQMQDHYVRIHRSSGATMELMPMKDAIALYGSAGGLRVHRSWWVARSAIAAVERSGRGFRIRLNDGLVVPVARNRIADLRALGLIPD